MLEQLNELRSSIDINYSFVGAFIFGLVLLMIIGRLLFMPVRLLTRLVISALIGGLLIVGINYVGNYFDFHLPLNPVTAVVAGVLGVPGVALLALVQRVVVG